MGTRFCLGILRNKRTAMTTIALPRSTTVIHDGGREGGSIVMATVARSVSRNMGRWLAKRVGVGVSATMTC